MNAIRSRLASVLLAITLLTVGVLVTTATPAAPTRSSSR